MRQHFPVLCKEHRTEGFTSLGSYQHRVPPAYIPGTAAVEINPVVHKFNEEKKDDL